MRVEYKNSSNETIFTQNFGSESSLLEQTNDNVWHLKSMNKAGNELTGVRYIYFISGGDDGFHWGGQFGTAFDNAYVKLTQEETLPVELSSFNASVTTGNNVLLSWTVESETGLIGYNILRGSSNNISQSLKMNQDIVTASNLSVVHSYSYHDTETEPNQEYYYWLNSLEQDGTSQTYGPIRVLTNDSNPGTPNIPLKNNFIGAYPNPFNPSTSLKYTIVNPGDVTIDIYNSKGQYIKTFKQSHNSGGTYSIVWDGKDSGNKSVTSGVYFFKLTQGKFTQTQKAVLMK